MKTNNPLNVAEQSVLAQNVADVLREHRYIRLGQAYMNELWKIRPELYNEVTATSIDPFHVDDEERMEKFWNYVIGEEIVLDSEN